MCIGALAGLFMMYVRHLNWQSLSWTRSMKTHTKTARWFCSSWETIWRWVDWWHGSRCWLCWRLPRHLLCVHLFFNLTFWYLGSCTV